MLALSLALAITPEPTSCPTDAPADARCAVVHVQEGPSSDRQIPLFVLVLPAQEPNASPDPVFVLQGGPGQAASRLGTFYAEVFGDLRRRRDIYMVDIRGTGASGALDCPIDTARSAGDLFPVDQIAACRQTFSARDLSSYVSAQVADDLETVRTAFGLPPVNIYGTSYGTRVALEWARRHPEGLRTMTLKGVTPPDLLHPDSMGPDAQAVWNSYVEACDADEACRAAFPSPDRLLAQTRAHIAATYQRERGALSPGMFGELIRNELYAPEAAASLFFRLRISANGDLSEWATKAARTGAAVSRSLSVGLYLSVTCAENIPFVDQARARLDAMGTFAGSYRLEQQIRACAAWNVPPAPRQSLDAVTSDVPTLLVSGRLDPVTPSANAVVAARTLSRGRSIVMEGNGHPMGARASCLQAMMRQLIETADPQAVDSVCATEPPPFRFKTE